MLTTSQVTSAAAELGDFVTAGEPNLRGLMMTMERSRAVAEIERHRARVRGLRATLAASFGTARGWKLSKRRYTVQGLAEGKSRTLCRPGAAEWPHAFADHPFFYCIERGQPVALAAHPYRDSRNPDGAFTAEAASWAAAHRLTVSFPDFPSWWFPGRTSIVLFQPATAAGYGAPLAVINGGRCA